MAPQAQGDQKLVQHLERREFVFIYDLALAEHFFSAFSRPLNMLDGPMHKDALEGHCLGQSDRTVFLRRLERQERRSQQRRAHQVRMVIGKG